MTINVFDLAQTDTSLKKVSHKEYAGSCPGCGGSDRFHVQPDRRNGGAWMCRNCWPAETKGWADGIEYLRQFRNMSFTAAKNFLAGEVDSLLETVYNAQDMHEQAQLPDNPRLQERYMQYVRLAITRLWTPQGKPCLDYLLSRGLSEDTIKKAKLGCIDSATLRREYLGRVEVETQFIVIPWYADKLLWRVNLRDIRPDVPEKERYRNFPKSGNGLYLADSLKRKVPTFLVEGEIDALSLAQEAGDLVNVVATGSTSGSLTSTWVTRLARVPSVLVAFDRESEAEQRANTWLKILRHNAMRYKPQLKDVNKMLVEGRNVRRWVLAILDYLSEDQDTSSLPSQEAPVLPALVCSVCGQDLATVDTGAYDENEIAYCNYDQATLEPYCSRVGTYEQFMATVNRIAGVFGPDCKITPMSKKGYTLEQHIARLQQQEQADIKRTIARRRNRASKACQCDFDGKVRRTI